MTALLQSFHFALPEIMILVSAVLALLGNLFFKREGHVIALVIASMGLILAAVCSYVFMGQQSTLLFSGLFVSDDVAHLMKLFIYLSVFLSFIYAHDYLATVNMPRGDYYVLGLFSTLGMMTLVSSHHLLTVYLGLELLSLPLYAMTAMQRNQGDSSEAALKYFIMGAIASGMLLYGISLLYGATGALSLQEVADYLKSDGQTEQGLVLFSLVFIVVGLGFKLAAVPFHMWAPDVYAGAPTPVTLFISAAPKIAALGMALRLLTLAYAHQAPAWQPLIMVMALLSAGVGNLLAIVQTNIKRLFAYSAISHMGYALLGVLAAEVNGYAAALYYVLVYALMTTGAFGLILLLSRAGVDIQNINDLKGLNKRNPWFAFLMMVIVLSMAGIPPTVGFFAKLLVLKALVDVHLTWVAVLALLFAVIGVFYYLRIIKVMYFDTDEQGASIELPKFNTLIVSLNALALLFLGFFPSGLITVCMNAF